MKIGIPRALLYYEYFPMWKTFFEELGVEVVVSENTTKDILNNGIGCCISDACLPMKIFHGHVKNLIGKCDYIFIPRLRSIAYYEYICPKFGGLPDMVKASIPDLPPIIDSDVCLRKSNNFLLQTSYEVAEFFEKDKSKIKKAYFSALKKHFNFVKMKNQGILPNQILENEKIIKTNGMKIAVIGHVYNVYDNFVNMNLFHKLNKKNIAVITPEIIDQEILDDYAKNLDKKIFWSFGRRILGYILYLIENKNVDGVIYIMSFGCGIDSFLAELCEKKLRRNTNIPFLLSIIDEHSGSAGNDTRLEAFIDMMCWRKKNESNISSYR